MHEIRQRHGINVEAAEKHRKNEFIELLNDDLRTGKFKVFEGSTFEHDSNLITWDYSNPEKPVISDIFHSDIFDSTLYGWKFCKHYIKNVAKPRIPDPNSDEYMEYRVEKLEREVAKQLRGQEDIVNDGDFDIIYGKDDW